MYLKCHLKFDGFTVFFSLFLFFWRLIISRGTCYKALFVLQTVEFKTNSSRAKGKKYLKMWVALITPSVLSSHLSISIQARQCLAYCLLFSKLILCKQEVIFVWVVSVHLICLSLVTSIIYTAILTSNFAFPPVHVLNIFLLLLLNSDCYPL